MDDFFKEVGIPLSQFAAAIVGGLTGLAFVPKHLTNLQRLVSAIGGFGCAAYLPAIAFHYLSIHAPSTELVGATSFIMGVVGMNLLGGLVVLSRRFRENPTLPPRPPADKGGGDAV